MNTEVDSPYGTVQSAGGHKLTFLIPATFPNQLKSDPPRTQKVQTRRSKVPKVNFRNGQKANSNMVIFNRTCTSTREDGLGVIRFQQEGHILLHSTNTVDKQHRQQCVIWVNYTLGLTISYRHELRAQASFRRLCLITPRRIKNGKSMRASPAPGRRGADTGQS